MHTHHPLPSPSSSHPPGPMHTRSLGHNNSFDYSLTRPCRRHTRASPLRTACRNRHATHVSLALPQP
ncbi:hypothetical protein HETIRDRAFT_407304 [Heterobasidion irregulare TC 32-1]|uniref:Uncharacterized protein n=1 Tax=Heterobasidion irregulare (strain TC 32-1) TaxID=747525 RepID=W4KGI4_HETIT|nr:uncharacterized protein HETIRDRAFT_407304 [Heterobasidion irregulare TC 32-1]ETW84973.1 hypothetical protein HETIRDRAFT_407304 [Heterobasidion irregulare TC 32-1]